MALTPTEKAIRDREKRSRAAAAKRDKAAGETSEDAELEQAETGKSAKVKKS